MRHYKFISLILIGIFSLMCGGCEKEIDFEYRNIEPIPVIEGTLSQYGAEVRITYTTPMDEPMDLTTVRDASVVIYDLDDGVGYPLSINGEGTYVSSLRGETGHTYRLSVEMEGKSYSSECTMLEPVEIVGMEFEWIKMPYDDVAALQVSFTDRPETVGDCYWLRLYRNGKAYKWTEIIDLLANDGIIDEVMQTTRRDLDEEDEKDILEDGDEVTAVVTPVSREMYDYLEALGIGNSNGPQMFKGNFCLGYFLAAPIASCSITFPDR